MKESVILIINADSRYFCKSEDAQWAKAQVAKPEPSSHNVKQSVLWALMRRVIRNHLWVNDGIFRRAGSGSDGKMEPPPRPPRHPPEKLNSIWVVRLFVFSAELVLRDGWDQSVRMEKGVLAFAKLSISKEGSHQEQGSRWTSPRFGVVGSVGVRRRGHCFIWRRRKNKLQDRWWIDSLLSSFSLCRIATEA